MYIQVALISMNYGHKLFVFTAFHCNGNDHTSCTSPSPKMDIKILNKYHFSIVELGQNSTHVSCDNFIFFNWRGHAFLRLQEGKHIFQVLFQVTEELPRVQDLRDAAALPFSITLYLDTYLYLLCFEATGYLLSNKAVIADH